MKKRNKKLPKYAYGYKKPIAPAAIQKDTNYNVMLNQGDGNIEPQRVYDERSKNQLIQDRRNNANNQMLNQTVSEAANAISQTGGKLGNIGLGNIGKGIGWLGLATEAEEVAKSFIPKDEEGNYKTNTGKAANEIITPDHEQMLNDIQNKKYGLALFDSTALGKFARAASFLTGVSNKTTGGWGKFNEFIGIPQELKTKEVKPIAPPETFYKDYQQDAVWQKLNNYQQYAMGGQSNNPNAEVEGNELMRYPDGSTQLMNGPSHENGGIPVNIPQGTEIFSDRLKLPGSKKTIAEEAKKYATDKEDKILSNKKSTSIAKNTAKLSSQFKQQKLDELFNAQEQLKQAKLAKYANKLGVSLPNSEFKMGGKKCYANGGVNLPKYPNGNSTRNFLDPYKPVFNKPIYPGQSYNPYQKSLAPWTVNTSQDTNLISQPLYGENSDYTTQSPTDYTDQYDSMRNRNIYEGIGNGLVQNAGNFYDLYQTNMGKKYDIEDYGSVNPRYYNPKTISATESLRDADREAAASRYALRNAVGGNTGAYLANLAANQTANTLNKAKIREYVNNTNTNILNQADLTNTSIRNDAERYNLDLKYRAKVDTSMNKARSEDIARQAVRGIGENLSESYKDYKLGESDQKKLALINQVFPNYKFNPNNFEFYYRSAKQANKPKKKRKKNND